MTHDKQPRSLNTPSDQHHGDLRKGAYLRRRAAYRMQASSGPCPQAGALTGKNKGNT